MAACPPRQIVVRTARPEDLQAVALLLDDAGRWMRSRGITDQWPTNFPLADLARRIDRSELYVAWGDDTAVGTFALDHDADPEFWQDDPDGRRAGYLHRLAVARDHAGRDIGSKLVDHAARIVADSDRRWLRLDCAKNNARLHAHYVNLGFTHVRTIDIPHRRSGALFQRRVLRA